jgi:hypothetical protein
MASAVLNERANIHNMTPSTPSSADDQSTALRPSNGGASSRIEDLEPAPPSTQLSATKAAAIADDGWESVEVEEMGAVVAPATPSSTIAAAMATHGASASSPFGSLMSSPPLQQQLHLSSLHAANPILVNNAAASPPKTTSNGGNLGPQLSYLQIAGSLMTSSTSTLAAANSSSPFSRPGLSNHQIVSTTSTPTPLVHPPPSASPFAFVPKPTTRDGHDGFKDAFEQARDKLHLFERRFGGDDGRETTTTASSTQDAAAAASATPTKGGDGKRKRSDEEADGENKRKEKKKAKKDEQSKKKQKQKKDKKSSKTVKKEDGSASLALDEKPEGGFTFMQGAYYILKREHRFMTAKEIVAIGVAEGTCNPPSSKSRPFLCHSAVVTLIIVCVSVRWWPPDLFASSKGKTPEATVAAGIYVDLKKPVSQFCQGCKGTLTHTRLPCFPSWTMADRAR